MKYDFAQIPSTTVTLRSASSVSVDVRYTRYFPASASVQDLKRNKMSTVIKINYKCKKHFKI